MSLASKISDLATRIGTEFKQVRTEIGGAAAGNTFVGPTPPVTHPAAYMWLQTGLGADGQGMTLWVEDGL
jgi:hypothetical protein